MASAAPLNAAANDGRENKPGPLEKFEDIDTRLSNELVIALVGPVGSGCHHGL